MMELLNMAYAMHGDFSSKYEDHLRTIYPDEIINQIIDAPKIIPLREQPYEMIPFIRINEGASKPVMFIPGFGEGILNKAPFAAELAMQGYDVILPGQNRRGIIKDNGRQATASQARNYAAILAAEGLSETGINFVAHSYGGLVFESLVQRITKTSPDYFKDSTAILAASAGIIPEKSYISLGKRWLKYMNSEKDQSTQDFPDKTGETAKASTRTLFKNVGRTIAEIKALRHEQIDFETLAQRVGHVVIMSYAEDAMFPEELMEERASAAVLAGALWVRPVSLDLTTDGKIRNGQDAVHDDEQLNPSRVAGSISQILKVVS